jgi:hypothetical protein
VRRIGECLQAFNAVPHEFRAGIQKRRCTGWRWSAKRSRMLYRRTCVRTLLISSEKQALQGASPCEHRSETGAMECKTCDSLLADYKYSVKLFTEAVRRHPGLVGHDRQLAHQKLEQLI